MLEIGGMAAVKSIERVMGAVPLAESVRPTSWVAIFTIPST